MANSNVIKRTRTRREHVDAKGRRLVQDIHLEELLLRNSGEVIDKVVTEFAPAHYPCGCPYAHRPYCPQHEYLGSAPWNVMVRWWKGRRHDDAAPRSPKP